MIKGGARNVVVRDSIFYCPGTTSPLFLAGQTDPIFRTRPNVQYELENFTFKNNKVYFADAHPSEPDGLHGVWDSIANASFLNNEFYNVGQILFVGKKTAQDLQACKNVTFNGNTIVMRPKGFSSAWTALIVNQGEEAPGGGFIPYLAPSEFHASDNVVYLSGDSQPPEKYNLIETGFEFRQVKADQMKNAQAR